MNLVFAGTPEFALPSLQALLAAGHRVPCVYTQPDRPAGRGRKLAASPIKTFAMEHGIDVRQPVTLKNPEQHQLLAALQPDAMIVIAYGLLLPKAILEIPKFGCINVHASLLPRWRGAAPIQRSIEAGDQETGVTIMHMEEGLDTGPMLASASIPIGPDDTSGNLHERLSRLGADLLVDTLARLERGDIVPQAQDDRSACYAAKLRKEEARIDWTLDAGTIARRIRAFNPWPVAHTVLDGKPLRIWKARHEDSPSDAAPGTVVSVDTSGIRVACGTGILNIFELQPEGGKALSVREFLNGRSIGAGARFGQ